MPGPFTSFRPRRFGEGYTLDWEGDLVFIRKLAAAKLAIDACSQLGVRLAKANHPDYPPESEPYERFASHLEQQTVDAIAVLDEARVEPKGWSMPSNPPHVWGAWGVEDRPRFHDDTGELQAESTKDIAMFLEFGTVKMEPRPFLYPAWDESKVMLPSLCAAAAKGMSSGLSFSYVRGLLG